MAEGILRYKLQEAGLEAEVDSAGTSNYHIGEHPNPPAIANMALNEIDISKLKARQFGERDFDHFDHIYVMDESNYENVMALARNEKDKAKVDLFMNLSHPGENMDVPDPYFGGDDGYAFVFELLSQPADVLITRIREQKS